MAKFIELQIDGKPILFNSGYIVDVKIDEEGRTIVTFAAAANYQEEEMTVELSYDQIKSLLV